MDMASATSHIFALPTVSPAKPTSSFSVIIGLEIDHKGVKRIIPFPKGA